MTKILLNLIVIGGRIVWLAAIAPRWRSLTLLAAVVALAATWLAWVA